MLSDNMLSPLIAKNNVALARQLLPYGQLIGQAVDAALNTKNGYA